ncbi:hypothetical protein ES703_61915 [subsurface metagenome]
MDIISRHQRNVKLTAHRNERLVYLLQLRNGVPLHFQVEIAKGLPIPQGGLFRLLKMPDTNKLGNLTNDTTGEGNETIVILLQKLLIHPRFIVETLKMCLGGKLNQILISGLIPGEENKVVIVFITSLTAEAAAGSEIHLTADNRLYPHLPSGLVKLNHAIHRAVVGNGQAVHTQFPGSRYQLWNAAHAVKQAIFGMDMEVSKHRPLWFSV